ncbi:hypothetical protein L1887_62331 [Cichorium endivia]|nr:hypothetical protein L1887_62331 [Cichorium endivia]
MKGRTVCKRENIANEQGKRHSIVTEEMQRNAVNILFKRLSTKNFLIESLYHQVVVENSLLEKSQDSSADLSSKGSMFIGRLLLVLFLWFQTAAIHSVNSTRHHPE